MPASVPQQDDITLIVIDVLKSLDAPHPTVPAQGAVMSRVAK